AGGIVDEVLGAEHLSRRVALQVPTFLVLPYLLSGTERIATVPAGIARELTRRHPLRIVKPPIAIPDLSMHQAWHELHRHDPGHRWLRSRITAAARKPVGASDRLSRAPAAPRHVPPSGAGRDRS